MVKYHVRIVTFENVVLYGGVKDLAKQGLTCAAGGR